MATRVTTKKVTVKKARGKLSFLTKNVVSDLRPFEKPVEVHTARVKRIKSLIFIAVVSMVACFLIWPFVGDKNHSVKLGIVEKVADDTQPQHMIRPRLHGVDHQGRPYTITADDAVQQSEKVVELKMLNADIVLNGESWISLASDYGLYDMDKKTLDLRDHITIFTDRGYEMKTSQAAIDLVAQDAVGNKEVEVHGPLGSVRADRFSIKDDGEVFLFEGGVHVVTYP